MTFQLNFKNKVFSHDHRVIIDMRFGEFMKLLKPHISLPLFDLKRAKKKKKKTNLNIKTG
jgi:hypothetical protein